MLLNIIAAAFFGSFMTYLFTKMKFQKDQLYMQKIESYQALINFMLKFKEACFIEVDLRKVAKYFSDFRMQLDKCYLFMPTSLYEMFRGPISTSMSKLGSFLGKEKKDSESENITYIDFMIGSRVEWTPDKTFPIIDIFTPFISQVDTFLYRLKEDIGTDKQNRIKKWFKKNKHQKPNY